MWAPHEQRTHEIEQPKPAGAASTCDSASHVWIADRIGPRERELCACGEVEWRDRHNVETHNVETPPTPIVGVETRTGQQVHVVEMGVEDWEVWLNTEAGDFDGICLAHGSTRADAIREAMYAATALCDVLLTESEAKPPAVCDCIASGNADKPKQHGADPHAKNCAIYINRQ